jgi:alpha-beta hydrolase superfamily lysophospholipase
VSSAETWVYRTAYNDTIAVQHVSFTLRGDTMDIQTAAGVPAHHMATRAGSVLYINPSAGLLEQALLRAKAIGGGMAQVPLFQAAGGQTVPLSVTWVGADSALLSLGGVEMRAAVDLAGRLTRLSVPAQDVRSVRVEGLRTAAPAPPPDYSAPPGAPYTAEEVTVRTPGGVVLAGTLTLPKVHPPRGAPAVVTITGSGTQERDEALPTVRGYRPFRQLADTLGRRGIAVLRMDDRGAGGSHAGPPGATSADFADDVRAALAYLRGRPEIDGDRIALVGHSEGGLIAPMVAASDPRLRAIVLMAGPSHTGRAIITYQQQYAIDSTLRLSGTRRDSALKAAAHRVDSLAAAQPWMKFFLDYDPLATAKRVKQPVLVMQGATDRQVTAEQANELAAAFRAGGNKDVTVRVLPETDHLFLSDPSGTPSGYAQLPSKSIRPEILGTIADWLVAHVGR